MKTFAQLKNFCEKNNVRYEINPIYKTYFNWVTLEDVKFVVGYEFGMNNIAGRKGRSEWQWVWFECSAEELTDDVKFFFERRYSMLNGKTYQGWRERFHVIETIERRS